MALPWRLALKAIPWAGILANAPELARSARALLSDTPVPPAGGVDARTRLDALAVRVEALEQRDRDTAEFVARLTAQNEALMAAAEVLAARVRWLLLLGAAAAVIAAAALVAVLVGG